MTNEKPEEETRRCAACLHDVAAERLNPAMDRIARHQRRQNLFWKAQCEGSGRIKLMPSDEKSYAAWLGEAYHTPSEPSFEEKVNGFELMPPAERFLFAVQLSDEFRFTPSPATPPPVLRLLERLMEKGDGASYAMLFQALPRKARIRLFEEIKGDPRRLKWFGKVGSMLMSGELLQTQLSEGFGDKANQAVRELQAAGRTKAEILLSIEKMIDVSKKARA